MIDWLCACRTSGTAPDHDAGFRAWRQHYLTEHTAGDAPARDALRRLLLAWESAAIADALEPYPAAPTDDACRCEWAGHFEPGGTLHNYGAPAAELIPAREVGAVCRPCARTHYADFVLTPA